jgi:hypothetical protein
MENEKLNNLVLDLKKNSVAEFKMLSLGHEYFE